MSDDALTAPLLSEERWIPVVGFELFYEVSSNGRVRSAMTRGGSRKGMVLACPIPKKGRYRVVTLRKRDRKNYDRQVHRLVLEAFSGPCPPGQESRHLNDIPIDNRSDNLAWGTRRENSDDIRRNGTRRGEKNSRAIVSAEDIPIIRDRKIPRPELARRFGLSLSAIADIRKRKNWSHVP